MSDNLNPNYYQFSGGVQPVDVAEHLTFNTGNAVKYLARAGRIDGVHKADKVEDLRKASWYITRELQRLEAKR